MEKVGREGEWEESKGKKIILWKSQRQLELQASFSGSNWNIREYS